MEEKTDLMHKQFSSSWDRILEKLSAWYDEIVLQTPNIILALLVVIAFYWISRIVRPWLYRIVRRFVKQESIRDLIVTSFSLLIISFGFLIALSVLNLDTFLKSLLAGAGVAGLAVGLALQTTLSNTFSGITLALKDNINIGDWVETNGYTGRVIEINLRNTKIREADNNIIVIPNKNVLENPFKNHSLTNRIKVTIKCGVTYKADLEHVKEIVTTTITTLFPPAETEIIDFHYLEFGDSSINFQVRFWVDATEQLAALEAKSKAIIAVKKVLDENGIEIPFPIRTVYMKN